MQPVHAHAASMTLSMPCPPFIICITMSQAQKTKQHLYLSHICQRLKTLVQALTALMDHIVTFNQYI